MATQNNIEFRVGLMVILGVVVLAFSLYWLQGYRLERNSNIIMVLFDDVGTLSIGDRVTVSGVHRGKVNRLLLTDNGVLVELRVYRDVRLRKDATFTIKNFGVMGERFIAIDPGDDSLSFEFGRPVSGQYDIGIPEVMGKLGEMITELKSLVSSLKATVASDSSLNKFNRTVDNVERLSASLSNLAEDNSGKVSEAVNNFLLSSRKLKKSISRNSSIIDSTFTRADRTSQRLERFAIQIDSVGTMARRFAELLENEDGTLQLLIQDRRLYDDLRKTADNIDDLVLDIRQNPRKYINFKVEIF